MVGLPRSSTFPTSLLGPWHHLPSLSCCGEGNPSIHWHTVSTVMWPTGSFLWFDSLGGGEVAVPESIQKPWRCGSEGRGLVSMGRMVWQLDWVIFVVYSNLNDSTIPRSYGLFYCNALDLHLNHWMYSSFCFHSMETHVTHVLNFQEDKKCNVLSHKPRFNWTKGIAGSFPEPFVFLLLSNPPSFV